VTPGPENAVKLKQTLITIGVGCNSMVSNVSNIYHGIILIKTGRTELINTNWLLLFVKTF